MSRAARLALADSRAMEEQKERANPVQPLQRGTRRGRTTLVAEAPEYVGGGATPSMGLSQIRGGRKSPSPSRSRSLSPDMEGGAMIGCGKGPDPEAMGKALSKHLVSLHGAGFADAFKKGMSAAPHKQSTVGSKSESAYMREGVRGGLRTGRYEGKGKLLIQHLPEGEGEEMVSGGAKAKKTRKAAGPDDGRRKRAEIVKKVMAEKGCSMIEASKYVKQHGLY